MLKQHSQVQKALLHKKKVRETAAQQRKFRQDPWKFGTEIFKPRNCGKPMFTATEAEKHFVDTYSDAARGTEYKAPPGCMRPPWPKSSFCVAPLEKRKLLQAVAKKRIKMPLE